MRQQGEDEFARPVAGRSARGHAARALGALAACSIMAQGCAVDGPPDTFDLTAPRTVEAEPVRGGTQILIAEPDAVQALDTRDIVVETAPFTIQYLAASQWGDRLPRLVQRRLAESFDRADRLSGVGLPGQGLAIDYQIVSDIRSFGIDIPHAAAEVEIVVKLLDDRNGIVRADRRFSATVPVSRSGTPDAYVRALNLAFTQVAGDIVAWVGELI